jgi:DNA-binding transcriptional MerR regulator
MTKVVICAAPIAAALFKTGLTSLFKPTAIFSVTLLALINIGSPLRAAEAAPDPAGFDILGMKLGMSIADIQAAIKAHDPALPMMIIKAAQDSQNTILAEYKGSYECRLGSARFTLQVLGNSKPAGTNYIFSFGPTAENPSVPEGSFIMQGGLDLAGGSLNLSPVSWLVKPAGFVMIGLVGSSADGGRTYSGKISGPGCTTFSVQRVVGSRVGNSPPQSNSTKSAGTSNGPQQPEVAAAAPTAPQPQSAAAQLPIQAATVAPAAPPLGQLAPTPGSLRPQAGAQTGLAAATPAEAAPDPAGFDILGMKLGMSIEEIQAAIKAYDPSLTIGIVKLPIDDQRLGVVQFVQGARHPPARFRSLSPSASP